MTPPDPMADLKLLEKLCRACGSSGREDAVRTLILREIEPHVEEVTIDPLGNLLVTKKGKNPAAKRVMLDAHMDEVAMMVTDVTGDGLLRVVNVGGIDPRVQCGVSVQVGEKAIPGVTGVKPIHLCKDSEKDTAPDTDDLYVDIGARNRDDALEHIAPGDVVCFPPHFERIGSNLLAKALDDRAGCALLVELLREELPYDLCASFSVQEEIGLRGAKTAAFSLAPDAAITLETTTAADIPGVPAEKQICGLGGGPVISFMDRHTIYDKEYYELAFRSAEKLGVKAQPKRGVVGGNNAGAVHASRGGVRTLAVSLPCRYLHAPVGMICAEDYDAALALVRDLAMHMAAGLDS